MFGLFRNLTNNGTKKGANEPITTTTSKVLNVFAGTKIEPNLTSVNEDVVD
jgi:hypothetical protein